MVVFTVQGLRTLELCVDNLQPDFLYDHIQPVRAELMQALWRCLRNPPDGIAHVAFRVLGKFGGSNRKMLREPQKVKHILIKYPWFSQIYQPWNIPTKYKYLDTRCVSQMYRSLYIFSIVRHAPTHSYPQP